MISLFISFTVRLLVVPRYLMGVWLYDAQTQTVSELKDFVKKLNSLPEMTVSIDLFS